MIIKLRHYLLREFFSNYDSNNRDYSWIKNLFRYSSNDKKIEQFDIVKIHKDDLKGLLQLCKDNSKDDYIAKATVRSIESYIAFASDESGKAAVKKLELLPEAIRNFFRDKSLKWIFTQNDDGEILPYFLYKCNYTPRVRTEHGWTEPYVTMSLKAYNRGKQVNNTIYFYKHNIGLSVGQIFQSMDILFETEEGVQEYIKQYKKFMELQTEVGKQMFATGTAEIEVERSYWWRQNKSVAMLRDGAMTKVLIDDYDDDEESSKNSSRRNQSDSQFVDSEVFWHKEVVHHDFLTLGEIKESTEDDEETEDESSSTVLLPIHPYLRIFDLDKHQYLTIYIDNLKPYPWDKSLIDKLVLENSQKRLIKMLVENTDDSSEDIIRGKMSGVIVMATGAPGTGKTLTAEVFSETIEKPLYVVQCSQLGLSTQAIETNLKDILKRAAKWKAILLIDEADVYIRQRGDDIEQNAIVGVFLRVLEYYRGVLFMASNRGDIVDDAIMSRVTAWIQYELPNLESLAEIWKVLGKQYGASFSDQDINQLCEEFLGVSGRTVRNLLKLARFLAKKEEIDINVDLIKEVSKYQLLESRKKYV